MAANVTERAGAEIPPATPFEWQISWMIRARWRRPEPQIPIKCRGHRRCVLWALNALRPILIEQPIGRTIRPDVDLAHGANRIVPNEFAKAARIFRSLALVAHLGGELVLPRCVGDLPRFPDRMREGLLAINMIAHFDRGHRNDCMQ